MSSLDVFLVMKTGLAAMRPTFSGVLQNLFVATAVKLCGQGGKNTVVC
jgi:hypothetical protein